jgi:hypothetical protein
MSMTSSVTCLCTLPLAAAAATARAKSHRPAHGRPGHKPQLNQSIRRSNGLGLTSRQEVERRGDSTSPAREVGESPEGPRQRDGRGHPLREPTTPPVLPPFLSVTEACRAWRSPNRVGLCCAAVTCESYALYCTPTQNPAAQMRRPPPR